MNLASGGQGFPDEGEIYKTDAVDNIDAEQEFKNVVILSDREENEDFWRESKDLRTDFTSKVP